MEIHQDHPDVNDLLERQTQDLLIRAMTLITRAPLEAQRLIDVINDDNNKGYVVVQAYESLFRIIDRVITDRNLKQIKKSKNHFLNLNVGKYSIFKNNSLFFYF